MPPLLLKIHRVGHACLLILNHILLQLVAYCLRDHALLVPAVVLPASVLRAHDLLLQAVQIAYFAVKLGVRLLPLRELACRNISFLRQVARRGSVLVLARAEGGGRAPVELRCGFHVREGRLGCLLASHGVLNIYYILILLLGPLRTTDVVAGA